MTNINFRFRKGAGSNLDIIFGTVTLKPTLAHSRGTSMVLPAPSTWDIVNGEVTATNVQPTPEPVDGALEWGYEVTVKDRHGKSYSFLVGVPDSTTSVEFVSLPRYFETKPPLFGQGPKGDAGEAATVAVGTVTKGTEASVSNSGTSKDAVLNFVLPKGDKGDKGDVGDKGLDGHGVVTSDQPPTSKDSTIWVDLKGTARVWAGGEWVPFTRDSVEGTKIVEGGAPNSSTQISYGWASKPHKSKSQKFQGGELVRENLATNPSFERFDPTSGRPYLATASAPDTLMTFGGTADITVTDQWSSSGKYSVKVSSTGSNAGSIYPWGSPVSLAEMGVEVGKTYTISCDVHLDQPLLTPTHSQSRCINVALDRGSGLKYDFAVSSPAPNITGTYRVSTTFTIPADAKSLAVRLVNGSTTVGDYLLWDSLLLEESEVSSEYFDGNSEWATDVWLDQSRELQVWTGSAWSKLDKAAKEEQRAENNLSRVEYATGFQMYREDGAAETRSYIQGFSINSADDELYVNVGGGNAGWQRIEIRDFTSGVLKDSKTFPSEYAYTQGMPWWKNSNGELLFVVYPKAVADGSATYSIYNYTTETMSEPISIAAQGHGDRYNDLFVTAETGSGSASTPVSAFYIYSWQSIVLGSPELLKTIYLYSRDNSPAKLQGETLLGDRIVTWGGHPSPNGGLPTLAVYDSFGQLVDSVQYSISDLCEAINKAKPGELVIRPTIEWEAEGITHHEGSIYTLHVFGNVNDTTHDDFGMYRRRAVILKHNSSSGVEIPKSLNLYNTSVQPRVLAGVIQITPSAPNTPTSGKIDFPPGYFTQTPVVTTTLNTSVPGTTVIASGVTGITKTGATVWVTRSNTNDTQVFWSAIQSTM